MKKKTILSATDFFLATLQFLKKQNKKSEFLRECFFGFQIDSEFDGFDRYTIYSIVYNSAILFPTTKNIYVFVAGKEENSQKNYFGTKGILSLLTFPNKTTPNEIKKIISCGIKLEAKSLPPMPMRYLLSMNIVMAGINADDLLSNKELYSFVLENKKYRVMKENDYFFRKEFVPTFGKKILDIF